VKSTGIQYVSFSCASFVFLKGKTAEASASLAFFSFMLFIRKIRFFSSHYHFTPAIGALTIFRGSILNQKPGNIAISYIGAYY